MSIDFGPRDFDSPFYDPDLDEHPIAKLYRHEYEAELRRLRRIDAFLATIGPRDAQLDLFSFAERRLFDLKGYQKRPRE